MKLTRLFLALVLVFVLWLGWLWRPAPVLPPGPAFHFADGFENATTITNLFPHDFTRWHGAQRESGQKPEVNFIELATNIVHSGTNALKLHAVPYDGRTASKADIQWEKFTFGKGQEVWFSGWYYLVGGTDAELVFLWDLETTQFRGSPGRRLYIQNGGWLASDLGKWWSGKTFRQVKGQETAFPKDQWVHLRVHMLLSENDKGHMEVWQNGVQVLDAKGKTLPTGRTLYSRLQVGITANGNQKATNTLYLDDIELSNRPLW
ncbi:MAG: hypothetical protein K0Q55_659 [Verrucomicrobia bacterium]|nr:hypothetical protein [Verrucomicrobiota bacterium]